MRYEGVLQYVVQHDAPFPRKMKKGAYGVACQRLGSHCSGVLSFLFLSLAPP